MGRKIPLTIKDQIIGQWLNAIPRDHIARNLGISQGTVSSVVDERRQTDFPDIDWLRSVSKELRKKEVDLTTLSSAIRITRKIQQLDISLERAENILELVEVNCFTKTDEDIEQFWIKIDDIYDMTHTYGLTIDESLDLIDEINSELSEKELQLLAKRKDIEDAEAKLAEVIKNTKLFYENLYMNRHRTNG